MKTRNIQIQQAVIFAGGQGKRLRPLTDRLPKPLAPVLNIPFLDYLLYDLARAGIKKVLMLLGYKHELIIDRYGERLENGMEIFYSVGEVLDRTGRRLLDAYPFLDDYFLLMYGDNFWPLELSKMETVYNISNSPILTTVFTNRNGTGEYGFENNVKVRQDGIIVNYDKTRTSKGLNGVDIGFFIVDKKVLAPSMEGNLSFEEDIFNTFVKNREVVANLTDEQYFYITDVNSLAVFEKIAEQRKLKTFKAF